MTASTVTLHLRHITVSLLNAIDRGFLHPLNQALQHRGIWLLTVGALVSLQTCLIFTHQPWLDEWQALQIALQSPDLPALLENLRYEGHPPLWYFVLQATALIVPPLWVLASAQAFIGIALQLTIQFLSPFSRPEKLLIGSSYFVLFEYGVISRSLALGALLLTLFFAFRTRRICWIAIILLPLTDFLFGILSIACITITVQERRLWWPGLTLWVISGLVAASTVMPAPDVEPALFPRSPLFDLLLYICRLSVQLIPIQMKNYAPQWNMPLNSFDISLFCGILFIIFTIHELNYVKLHLILLGCFFYSTLIFSIFLYPLPIRHLSLIAYFFILLKWREIDIGLPITPLFRLWLLVLSLSGLLTAVINLNKPFHMAFQAAHYIQQHNLEDKHWISFPDSRAQGISALLGIEFHRLESDCTQSFMRWNYRTTIKKASDLQRVLHGITKEYGRVYMVTDFRVRKLQDSKLVKMLAAYPAGYDGQEFYLYAVGPDLPESARRPPQCAPARKPLALWASR